MTTTRFGMGKNQKFISWDRPMLERFKLAYQQTGVDTDVFIFDGNEFVRDYAKYLIEYLETRLPDDPTVIRGNPPVPR